MRDLGPAEIPVRLRGIALTDRGDGTVYALQNDGANHIKIVSPLPTGFRGDTYEAYAGPVLSDGPFDVRLLIRDGHLGYEPIEYTVGSRPVLAPNKVRARHTDTLYQLRIPDGFAIGDVLAYETEPDIG